MFDSHCHLTDAQYAPDLDAVLERARAAGIRGIVTIASNAADSAAACDLAARCPNVRSTVGIHPHEASTTAANFGRVVELLERAEVVAIGETGLDFHYENSPRADQRASFERHLELAAARGMPVVVHSRDADEETAAMLRSAGAGVRGVLHCFSGGAGLLETALELGWFISFAGVVTFRKFQSGDLLRRVPDPSLLLETDGPYLAPVPWRGRRNEPAYLTETCKAVARIREQDVESVAAFTTANARRFYRID
ncbi:MAG: TatD family hydrolase [Gemmatimonadetes bacterium]|nr:TatD family hydrolase [Gemmatimonadota bacterium]